MIGMWTMVTDEASGPFERYVALGARIREARLTGEKEMAMTGNSEVLAQAWEVAAEAVMAAQRVSRRQVERDLTDGMDLIVMEGMASMAAACLEMAEQFREDGAGPVPTYFYLMSGERRELEERLGKVRGRVEELLVLMRTREDGQVEMGLKVGALER